MAIQKKGGTAGAGASGVPANAVSLKPSDQQQGGILDDMDVDLKSLTFVEYDYNGKADKPTLALLVVMGDSEGTDHDQYFSAGDLSRFQPSPDGKYAVAVAGAKGLSTTSNAALFLKSIVDQGFPEDKITHTVEPFEGANVHVVRVPQPKRSGLVQAEGERERTVLVVSKINRLPWETAGKARPTGKAATSASAGTRPPARQAAPAAQNGNAVENDLIEEAQGIMLQLLEAKGGEVAKKGIAPGVFKLLAGNPARAELLKMLTDEEFLLSGAKGGLWAYENSTVSAA
jgi:hypothetical protein